MMTCKEAGAAEIDPWSDWSTTGDDDGWSTTGDDDWGTSRNSGWITVCPDGRFRTSGNYCMDCGVNCLTCADETAQCTSCKALYQPMANNIDCFLDPADLECRSNQYMVITPPEVRGLPDNVECLPCGGNCPSC